MVEHTGIEQQKKFELLVRLSNVPIALSEFSFAHVCVFLSSPWHLAAASSRDLFSSPRALPFLPFARCVPLWHSGALLHLMKLHHSLFGGFQPSRAYRSDSRCLSAAAFKDARSECASLPFPSLSVSLQTVVLRFIGYSAHLHFNWAT